MFQMAVWKALFLLFCILDCMEQSASLPVAQTNSLYLNCFKHTRSTRTRVQQLLGKYVSTKFSSTPWSDTSCFFFSQLKLIVLCNIYRRSSSWETGSLRTEADTWRICPHFPQNSIGGLIWRLVSPSVFQNTFIENHSLINFWCYSENFLFWPFPLWGEQKNKQKKRKKPDDSVRRFAFTE